MRLLAILLLAAAQAFAAEVSTGPAISNPGMQVRDESARQIEALQAALAESQTQTAQSNQVRLQMAVEIAALRKSLEDARKELEAARKAPTK